MYNIQTNKVTQFLVFIKFETKDQFRLIIFIINTYIRKRVKNNYNTVKNIKNKFKTIESKNQESTRTEIGVKCTCIFCNANIIYFGST